MPLEAVIPLDTASCFFKVLEIAVPGSETADCVEHEVDFDTCPSALRHRFHKALGNLAFLKDVSLEINAPARLADCFQLCFIEVLAIRQDFYVGALVEGGICEGCQDSFKGPAIKR